MAALNFIKEAFKEHKKLTIAAFLLSVSAITAFPIILKFLIGRKKKEEKS